MSQWYCVESCSIELSHTGEKTEEKTAPWTNAQAESMQGPYDFHGFETVDGKSEYSNKNRIYC